MTHPNKEELQELYTLIITHTALLVKHVDIEFACGLVVEREPNLLAAEVILAEQLTRYGYKASDVCNVYAPHSDYQEAFDNGQYDSIKGTWASDLGEVPLWALLHLYP